MEGDDVVKWFEENKDWLTEWLTNIVVVDQVRADASGAIFQTFVEPIPVPATQITPDLVLDAMNNMKFMLLQHAVFGVGQRQEKKGEKIIKPACFSGFSSLVDRLPVEGDVAIFTATHWFNMMQGITASGVSIYQFHTVTTLDVFPLGQDEIQKPKWN